MRPVLVVVLCVSICVCVGVGMSPGAAKTDLQMNKFVIKPMKTKEFMEGI